MLLVVYIRVFPLFGVDLLQTTSDVVKMDVEGSEWPALEAMFEENSLKNVKQLLFEVHLERQANLHQFQLVYKLEELGFRKFGVHINHYNRFVTSSGRRLSQCYELSYMNIKYLEND